MSAPTKDQEAAIRQLAEAAGGADELVRWVRTVAGRRPGRPKGASRLAHLDNALLVAVGKAAERCSVPKATLIRLNVEMGCMTRYGASEPAVIERLQAKARRQG